MKILETRSLALPEVKIVTYARFRDERGYFTESFRQAQIDEALGLGGLGVAQANESHSAAGVVRGLHAQYDPFQGKLVRPLYGRLIDLALDIRKGSPTFGKIVAYDMPTDPGADTGEWIWLPPGFAHGVVFPEDSCIEYLCTSAWSPGCELSISPVAEDLDWSLCDPDLRGEVEALLGGDVRMNEKDRDGLTLAGWRDDPRSEWFVHSPGSPFDVTSRLE